MAGMSDYLEVQLRAHIFRTASFTKPAELWVSLHTGALADDASGTEVSGGDYARVQRDPADANWTAPDAVAGVTANAAEIAFPAPTGNWGTIAWAGIWDAASGGNLIARAQLGATKVVSSGDAAPKFPAGTLIFTFA